MNDVFLASDVLADGFRRALDAYLGQKANPPAPSRRRSGLQPLPPDLAMVLEAEFPAWSAVAETAARASGRDLWWLDDTGAPAARLTVEVEEFLDAVGNGLDSQAIAMRVADYLAGPPSPAWEYVTVDLRVPVVSMPLFGGWELCGVDRVNDPSLPLDFTTSVGGQLSAPEDLHSRGFGALRRPKPATALDATEPGGHDLVWPLLILNLLGAAPVRAFTAYQVEPGHAILTRSPERTREYLPAELVRWHQQPLSLLPSKPHRLGPETSAELQPFAAEVGSLITTLSPADRQILGRAAKYHLHLAYHGERRPLRGQEQVLLDAGEVALRRCTTIEALLAATDNDTESIGRKLSQRAAVLAANNDADRLAVRDLVRTAYSTRSAEAHGSGRLKPVDLGLLEGLTRMIIRRWLALAALYGAKRVGPLLDDALLSTGVRDGLLTSIADHEARAVLR